MALEGCPDGKRLTVLCKLRGRRANWVTLTCRDGATCASCGRTRFQRSPATTGACDVGCCATTPSPATPRSRCPSRAGSCDAACTKRPVNLAVTLARDVGLDRRADETGPLKGTGSQSSGVTPGLNNSAKCAPA